MAMEMAMEMKPPKKTLLIIALDHSCSQNEDARLDNWYEDLCVTLREVCKVYGAVISSTALIFLNDDQYQFDAVVLTDPVIMSRRDPYPDLRADLLSYVRAGGTLIFAPYCRLGFAASVQATDVNSFMERVLGLPWKLGSADAREFKLNGLSNIRNKEYWFRLLTDRNVSAVQLDGAEWDERVYYDPETDGGAAIFAAYDRGYVAWIGDVILKKATIWMMIILGDLYIDNPETTPDENSPEEVTSLHDPAISSHCFPPRDPAAASNHHDHLQQ